MKGAEFGTIPAETTVTVWAVPTTVPPEHGVVADGSVGKEKSVYVTVEPTAPGLKPPDSVAVSVTDEPMVSRPEGLMTVEIDGLVLFTVNGSH